MRKGLITLTAISLVASVGLTACNSDEGGGGGDKTKVGVILPDSASAVRWETADRRYLEAAFELPDHR
jgi:D-xylose transport system substrate-binding protein